MKKRLSVLLTLVTTLFLVGCASTGNVQLGKCSKEELSCKIINNVTTKNDIRLMFGDPQEIDFDLNYNEKWKYSFKHSSVMPINFIPIVSDFKSGTNDITKNLILIFNANGTVLNHVFSEAKGETYSGLLR